MKYCEVKNPPEFTEQIERWTRETDADGEAMAVPIEQLLNNTVYLREQSARQERNVIVALSAGKWSVNAPYTQRVAVPGVKASDNPVLGLHIPAGLSTEAAKVRQRLTGMLTGGTTEEGYVIFRCGIKKPDADFEVMLRGVSGNG